MANECAKIMLWHDNYRGVIKYLWIIRSSVKFQVEINVTGFPGGVSDTVYDA